MIADCVGNCSWETLMDSEFTFSFSRMDQEPDGMSEVFGPVAKSVLTLYSSVTGQVLPRTSRTESEKEFTNMS